MRVFCKQCNCFTDKDCDSHTRNFICWNCETLHIGTFGYQCCRVFKNNKWTLHCTIDFFIKMTEKEDLFCDLIKSFKGRIRTKTEIGSWQSIKRKAALSENDWAQQLAEELHKPIKRKFKTRKVILYCKWDR